jgi:RNA polymerase sigma-70 factor, ECF subfamily
MGLPRIHIEATLGITQTTDRGTRTEIAALVNSAAQGDHEAYGHIVDAYTDSLLRLAVGILRRPAEAEDAVQEAFIKAYVHLGRYNSDYSFYTWISSILTNVCYSALRARDWHVAPLPDQLVHAIRVVDHREEPELAALAKSRDQLLRSALDELPEKYRQVLMLRYWSDLSYQEVAAATNQSMGAVKTQIHRATQLLRDALTGHPADFATGLT